MCLIWARTMGQRLNQATEWTGVTGAIGVFYRSFHFVHVIKHTTRNADGQHRQLADGLVLYAARNVDNDSRV